MDVLFDMVGFHVHMGIRLLDPIGEVLGKIHRSMLPSGVSERDHEVAEVAFEIVVDALSDKAFDMVEEHLGLGFRIKILDHFPIATRLGLELRFSSRVG